MSPCALGGSPCYSGECIGTQAAPACKCGIDREGAQCERCAFGFQAEQLSEFGSPSVVSCAPTCQARCSALEECVIETSPNQVCRCIPGYHRAQDGSCAWNGLLTDPDLAYGCATWEVVTYAPNPGTSAHADVRDGEITLSASHVCVSAGAVAEASFPTEETVPHGAVRFSANGSMGAVLGVSLQADVIELPVPPGGLAGIVGTGAWQEHSVCIGGQAGHVSEISFGVGQVGNCMDRLDHAFRIRDVSVVSDPTCP